MHYLYNFDAMKMSYILSEDVCVPELRNPLTTAMRKRHFNTLKSIICALLIPAAGIMVSKGFI